MKAYRITVAALCWLALVLQYWLSMTGPIGPGPFARTINFFSHRVQFARSAGDDLAVARAGHARRHVLFTRLDAHGHRRLHDRRRRDLYADPAAHMVAARTGLRRGCHAALRDAGVVFHRLVVDPACADKPSAWTKILFHK